MHIMDDHSRDERKTTPQPGHDMAVWLITFGRKKGVQMLVGGRSCSTSTNKLMYTFDRECAKPRSAICSSLYFTSKTVR